MSDKDYRIPDRNMCWQCGHLFDMEDLPESDEEVFVCPDCHAQSTADDLYFNDQDYVWVL